MVVTLGSPPTDCIFRSLATEYVKPVTGLTRIHALFPDDARSNVQATRSTERFCEITPVSVAAADRRALSQDDAGSRRPL
jgi:hypothetical protein